jgi:hypothetical protein
LNGIWARHEQQRFLAVLAFNPDSKPYRLRVQKMQFADVWEI